MGDFPQNPLPASEDVTSDDERMVICEEEGDDDVMGTYCDRNKFPFAGRSPF